MSKRKNLSADGRQLPVLVRDFRTIGYLPEAMFNFLALIGWSYDDHTEFMTRQEIIDRFSIDRVNPAPATFHYDKLDHFNGVYIRELSVDDLTDRLMPVVRQAGIDTDRETLKHITPLIQERMKHLDEAPALIDFFFAEELPDYDPQMLSAQENRHSYNSAIAGQCSHHLGRGGSL